MKRLILLTVLAGLPQPVDFSVGSEVSNFLTPYGFRTPLSGKGQCALSSGSHYERTESEEDYPPSKGSLSLYPGQIRLTQWHPWFDPYEEVMG